MYDKQQHHRIKIMVLSLRLPLPGVEAATSLVSILHHVRSSLNLRPLKSTIWHGGVGCHDPPNHSTTNRCVHTLRLVTVRVTSVLSDKCRAAVPCRSSPSPTLTHKNTTVPIIFLSEEERDRSRSHQSRTARA